MKLTAEDVAKSLVGKTITSVHSEAGDIKLVGSMLAGYAGASVLVELDDGTILATCGAPLKVDSPEACQEERMPQRPEGFEAPSNRVIPKGGVASEESDDGE